MAGGEKALHSAGAERGDAGKPAGLSRSARAPILAGACGWGATLLLFWPGIALYDSVEQYRQALSGDYDDWHPPVMARLWSIFAGWWPGGAPLFLIQTSLYWIGLGLLAAACARRERVAAGWAVLAAGSFLVASCWLGALLKDSQMVGALAAAVGLVAWYRLDGRPVPAWAAALSGLLLLYATLLRANAAFATVPLALMLGRIPLPRGRALRTLTGLAALAGVLLLLPTVNRGLLGAERSGVENSLLAYDLTGIAVRSGTPFAGGEPGTAGPGCYSTFAWDPAGEPGCPGRALMTPESRPALRLWLDAILHHPLAYAGHRLAHFDMTMRLFVPSGLPQAVAPVHPEPNRLGLGAEPRAAALRLHALGHALAGLPPSWPGFWLGLDLVVLWSAASALRAPMRNLALALALSALIAGASFLLVSVASDLRYHLWTMLATAMALALLAGDGALRRRQAVALLAAALLLSLVGVAGRTLLPPIP